MTDIFGMFVFVHLLGIYESWQIFAEYPDILSSRREKYYFMLEASSQRLI